MARSSFDRKLSAALNAPARPKTRAKPRAKQVSYPKTPDGDYARLEAKIQKQRAKQWQKVDI